MTLLGWIVGGTLLVRYGIEEYTTPIFFGLLDLWVAVALVVLFWRAWIGTMGEWAGRFLLVFGAATLLRMGLSLVNFDSHDGHILILDVLLAERRLPTLEDCVQCYSPKLYYIVCAGFVSILDLEVDGARILAMQFVTFVAGVLNIGLIGRWIARAELREDAKLIGFALIAANPVFLGYNAMGSNDTFVFLFATLAVDAVLRVLRTPSWPNTAWLTLWLILAGLSKGSALVIFGVVMVALVIDAFILRQTWAARGRGMLAALGVGVAFGATVPWLGQYLRVEPTGGTYIFNPPEKAPLPEFFEESIYNEEEVGVRSLYGAFFTFHFWDLLKHPQRELRYVHETSLWSSLYGGLHAVYFPREPHSWRTDSGFMAGVTRVLLVLGLLPLLVFFWGVGRLIRLDGEALRRRDWAGLQRSAGWVLLGFVLAFLLAEIAWVLTFRDADAMRPVYLFPAALPFGAVFVVGLDRLLKVCADRWERLLRVIYTIFGAIICLYALQTVHLIGNLAWRVFAERFLSVS